MDSTVILKYDSPAEREELYDIVKALSVEKKSINYFPCSLAI